MNRLFWILFKFFSKIQRVECENVTKIRLGSPYIVRGAETELYKHLYVSSSIHLSFLSWIRIRLIFSSILVQYLRMGSLIISISEGSKTILEMLLMLLAFLVMTTMRPLSGRKTVLLFFCWKFRQKFQVTLSDFSTKFQFRPILAAYNQASYKISKFLVHILSPLTTNQFTVSNFSEV